VRIKGLLRQGGKILYFGSRVGNEPTIVSLGGRMRFTTQYRDSITWLKSVYDSGTGLWDGSFFSSTHVLEALLHFGEAVDVYKSATLSYIYKHDLNGSYDNVFAATGEMARIYYVYGEHARFERAVAWIQGEMVGKPAADVARAFQIFQQCELPVRTDEVQQILSGIGSPDSDTNL